MNARTIRGLAYFFSLLVVALPPASLFADEKADDEATKRIKHLIGMLASRNAAPRIVGDPGKGEDAEITFEKTYDTNLQVPVYLAMQQLLAEGEAALELLRANANDARYSLSINSINDSNLTVG